MIEFTCNTCGQKFSAPESRAGKKGRCPKCRNVVSIPDVRKSESALKQKNSSGPQDGPRYSAFDLTLLEVPQIGEAQEKQTGGSGQATGQTSRIKESLGQEEDESGDKRRLPWLIDIFLYPANKSGLAILGIIIAIRWFSIIVIRSLGYTTPALSPSVVIVVPLISISILVRVILYLYFYWYLCECVRDSAEGGLRAPETINRTPGLGEMLWLLRSFVSLLLFAGPVLGYYFSAHKTDTAFWILFVFGVLFLPMSFLAFVMFDSVLSSLNPVLLAGSIGRVFLPYCAMILIFMAAGFFAVNIVQDVDFTLLQAFIVHCIELYLLMVLAHLLGWFYHRYRQQLNWDV
jgi:hypothetical protein